MAGLTTMWMHVEGGAASARDEWMAKVAVLARACPLTALPLLSNLIAHRQSQVAHAITAGNHRMLCSMAAHNPSVLCPNAIEINNGKPFHA